VQIEDAASMKTKTPRSKLRTFGFTVGTAMLFLGAVFWYFGSTRLPTFLGGAGGLLVVLGLAIPQVLAPVERAWMGLAMVLAWINTRIILSLLFVLVLSPIGMIMRVFRDPLNRKLRDGSESYWIPLDKQPADREKYERQF
jgi:hypothetical protein